MTWSDLEGERRDREDALGQALRALPSPRAPRTLAPRVMALVQARAAARVAPTWFDWPVWAQLASVVGFVALVASAALVSPLVERVTSNVTSTDAVRVTTLFFRSVWQPLVLWLVVAVTATVLVCATVGALLTRVALGGASR